MRAKTTDALRWFVGLSLLVGAFALLAGALGLLGTTQASPWVDALVAVAAILLAGLAAFERSTAWPAHWPWHLPALLPVLLLMIGVVWSRFGSEGHLFLSAFAPFVAFLTGLGILARRRWAWPVAFASVTGFGPTILLFAPLPEVAIAGAFVLFVIDAAFLLALVPSFFEPVTP